MLTQEKVSIAIVVRWSFSGKIIFYVENVTHFFNPNMVFSQKSCWDTDWNAEIKIQLAASTQNFYVSRQIMYVFVPLFLIYEIGIIHMLSGFSVQSV